VTRVSSEYVDIREIHPDFFEQECWNCGYTELRKRPFNSCPGCFMGQEQTGADGEYTTDEGYVDYRKLWYGDVSLEEAHRRYEENTEDTRRRIQRRRARERTVRL